MADPIINDEEIRIEAGHKFMPVNTTSERLICKCRKFAAASIHTSFDAHDFINTPGVANCGLCDKPKDYEWHTQTSSSTNTYRKPLAYRFDLIPPIAERRVAAIYEEGAIVYGPGKYINTPMPWSNVINHLKNHLNLAISGDTTEDHWAKVVWAANTMMVYETLDIGENDLHNSGVKSTDLDT